ncbi:MAG: hypothetical protein HFJ35_04535 [Clostridia bacterium]|nr:hypothetical protein [Clostridia bacterium]
MMMPKKKKITILIVSIIAILLAIAITFIILYIQTDMFKSDATLFAKYMGQTVENIDAIYQEIETTNEYEERLKQNKYTMETEIKVNDTEEMGTTSENTQNQINQLSIKVNGQVDNNNQYNYQDISLWNLDKKVTELEYVQKEDIYGIRFSDLYKQYIGVNEEDLKDLLETASVTKESEISEDILELKSIFQLSKEEKQLIETKYINIINSNVSKDNFTRQKNQTIQIDGKNVNANAYILTLTKEKMNNIFIEILEQLKQDEMILTRIDKLQTLLENYQLKQENNLREVFAKEIEEQITEITRNNIGQEEVKIIVYENYHNTVRVMVQNPEYEITIDLLSMTSENYIQISNQDKTTEKEQKQVISYKKTEEGKSIIFENTKNGKTTEYSLSIGEKINGDNCAKTIIAKYEDDSSKVEATIQQEINIVTNLEKEVSFNNENLINLSELEEQQTQSLLEQVSRQVTEKVTEITTNDIKIQDLWEVLKVIGLIKEGQTFEVVGVTEVEKNRFNSKFEILQGENLGSEEVLNLINAIKDNLIDMEVMSNTELKLKLDQFNKNDEIVSTLTTFIEGDKNRKYNAKIEYDEETGLVSDIILSIVEKQ